MILWRGKVEAINSKNPMYFQILQIKDNRNITALSIYNTENQNVRRQKNMC